MHEDEELGLVDANDMKIGTFPRSKIESLKDGGGRYLRTATALIRNSAGKYWIPRRATNKRIAPSGLDFSMAEHMGVDETYIDAALRGFKEELNLDLTANDIRLIGIEGPVKGLPYFRALYLYETNKEPSYNPGDFTEAMWLEPKEIIARLEAGEPAKSSLILAVKLVLLEEGQL